MKLINKYSLILFIGCLFFANSVLAGGPPIPPDPGVPIDGGLTLLIAAGAGYGIKKLRKHQQQKAGKDEEINP